MLDALDQDVRDGAETGAQREAADGFPEEEQLGGVDAGHRPLRRAVGEAEQR
jgi:hypothetical protein